MAPSRAATHRTPEPHHARGITPAELSTAEWLIPLSTGLVPARSDGHAHASAAVGPGMPVFSNKPGSEPAGSRRWLRRLRLGLVALVVIALAPATSLAKSLTAPGTDPLAARAAEWARGHGLGFLITAAEELTYHLNPPRKGGRPDQSLLRPALSQRRMPTDARTPRDARTLLHASLRTIVSPSLPGEGVFGAVVSGPRGRPCSWPTCVPTQCTPLTWRP